MKNPFVLNKYKCEEIEAFTRIKKIWNEFLMHNTCWFKKQYKYVYLSYFYHAIRSSHFVNAYEKHDISIVLFP
jgi:hypothetical protein